MPAPHTTTLELNRAAASLAERERLREFVNMAQGDPRLTAFEERFVADIRNFVERRGHFADMPEAWRLSRRQVELVQSIEAKLKLDSDDLDDLDCDSGNEDE